ncbi:DUF192 domain-containing protein [Pararhizobium sp. IMCC21322]|uniref:DUF192 domain-containing protein n=1 Tax=Pararhizobium sp. IMCC21322 TaxID=3067903 RepID=UPI00274061D0|nr:DUF192 domain-containing protein [Pararhizobium sp. IMCC21322]
MSKNFDPARFRRGLSTIVVAVALLFGSAHFPLAAQQPQSIAPNPVFLSIETRTGVQRFIVEIADEQKEREVGLMFREELPQDQGMLFDFGIDRLVSMWMRNTPLSLDMVFINRAGTVVRVAENTTPFSTNIISSGEPIRYVLELNAGVASDNGIRSGDKVMHPLLVKNLSSD